MREIILDTETTGLLFYEGHKITEIGCVEIINNQITTKTYHTYINPLRPISESAKKITGITDEFLKNKPLFKDIVNNFFKFLKNTDNIIMHNANFDTNFINHELHAINYKIKNINKLFNIIDSLKLARKLHPRKKNNLNALCERYNIKNTDREFHGALKDAKLLAKVYLHMINISKHSVSKNKDNEKIKIEKNKTFKLHKANEQELKEHIKYINSLKKYA